MAAERMQPLIQKILSAYGFLIKCSPQYSNLHQKNKILMWERNTKETGSSYDKSKALTIASTTITNDILLGSSSQVETLEGKTTETAMNGP